MKDKDFALPTFLLVAIACILIMLVIIVHNHNYNNNANNNNYDNHEIIQKNYQVTQPGTFFDADNPRFVVVDCGTDFGGRDCIVYADTVSGTMYMVVDYYGDYVGFTLPSDVFQYDSDNFNTELIE